LPLSHGKIQSFIPRIDAKAGGYRDRSVLARSSVSTRLADHIAFWAPEISARERTERTIRSYRKPS
jgi:hypothetical protein